MPRLAKLTRPKLHQVVPRARLFDRLDACRERPLTWVMGPPGAGKTSLVASYAEARHLGTLWYQLDAGDADLETFFHYLSAAAEDKRKHRLALPALTPQHLADLPGFARLYFRALFARLREPGVLVLDNYHELPAEHPLHGLLEAIVREVPEDIGIIVISRTPPPPACAPMRALDRVALLEWDELRLTLEETREIAQARYAVDDEALRSVHASTDGWPVGLVLVLEEMRRFGVARANVHNEGREVLFDYFAGHIFASLPEATRRTLMLVALLPRATTVQADDLTGEPDAGAVLEGLYRRRLFVDRRCDTYQIHDLFRAFLLQQFEGAFDAEEASRWRRAAAELLAQADQLEAAFESVATAHDWPHAASLVMRFAPKLLEQGRLGTLRGWIEALPEPVLDSTPWLVLWRGVSLSPFAPLQARAAFETAYARFGEAEPMGRILSCGGILATHYLEFDHGAVDHWLDVLLPQVASSPPYPAKAAEVRVNGALLFALSYQRPRRELVDATLARLRALLPLPEVPLNPRVDAATLMLAHHQIAADFDEAERIVAMASPWLAEPELTPNYRALWTLQLAHFRAKQGRDAEAAQLYDEAQKIADDNALVLPPLRIYAHFGRATLALNAGDPDRAEAERALAASRWTFTRSLDRALDAGFRAWIAMHRGEHAEALACARLLREQVDAVGSVWLRCGSRLQLAIAELEVDPDADISGVLGEARDLLEGTCLGRLVTSIDAVEAWWRLRTDGLEAARPWLERCVAGREAHYGQFFLRLHPRVMPEVYAAALALGIAEGDARRAIQDYRLRAPDIDPPGWPWPFQVHTLGRFEVLRDGAPLTFSRKVPRKTLALLKAIIALGGRSVSEQRVLDALWPNEEGDAAANSLTATVLRLRALLGDAAAIVQQGGKLSLDRERVWVDVFAFEQAIAAAEAAAHRHDPAEHAHLARALALYQGAFLAEDEGEAWPVAARERLRGRFIHALGRHAERLEANGDFDAAVLAYLRGLDADPAVESFYQGLMRCYQRLGRRSEAISAYQRLKQVLSITLGLAPSAGSERLYQSVRAE